MEDLYQVNKYSKRPANNLGKAEVWDQPLITGG
jgi:hypothetical protein